MRSFPRRGPRGEQIIAAHSGDLLGTGRQIPAGMGMSPTFHTLPG